MKYENIVEGNFIYRKNRFLAYCEVEGREVAVHVPNTSRLTELCIEGTPVILERAKNPQRKTKFTLIHIQKNGIWINIDSQAPNTIVYEALKKQPGIIGLEEPFTHLQREVAYHHSRFDLYYETKKHKGFLEIKGVTLEEDGIAMFPGAPTTRGVKHLRELILAQEEGYRTGVFFCVQVPYAKFFKPHRELDPEFGRAYDELKHHDVDIYAYRCDISAEEVILADPIEIE